MKQLQLDDLVLVSGGAPGGPISSPDLPPREAKAASTDGSYTPPPPPKTEEGN